MRARYTLSRSSLCTKLPYDGDGGGPTDFPKRSAGHCNARPIGYEGAPHLPPLMTNVTVDDALDSVAQTFKGIVLYGACTQPDGKELFDINYIDGS
jgi:hypothetical protein